MFPLSLSPSPLPSPLPAGADIDKGRIVWFEIADDTADRLQTPIMNWISRASSKEMSEESAQIMGARLKFEMVVGESQLKKLLVERLFVTDLSVLAKEVWDVTISDFLDDENNCSSVLRTYEKFQWSSLNIAMCKAKIEGVAITQRT